MGEKTLLFLLIFASILIPISANTQPLSLSIPVVINESNTINDIAQIYNISLTSLANKISTEINQNISENDSLDFIYNTYDVAPPQITEIAQNLKSEPEDNSFKLFILISFLLTIILIISLIIIIREK